MFKLKSVKLWLLAVIWATATVAMFMSKIDGTIWWTGTAFCYGTFVAGNVASKRWPGGRQEEDDEEATPGFVGRG
jgi:hypothetical protein